jgi:hypothetical protein
MKAASVSFISPIKRRRFVYVDDGAAAFEAA